VEEIEMSKIPTEMQALVLNAYNSDLETAIRSLQFGVRPVRGLKPGQVLVRMEAAPCNPSDLLFLQRMYGVVKTLRTVRSWEGAGTVVSAGSLMGQWLVGRRVAVGGQGDQDGTWAEYFVAGAFGGCVPLHKDLDAEQGATLPEQVDLLHELGADNVLDSSAPDFQQQLVGICTQLKVTAAFDAVAGAMTGQLLEAMSEGAVISVYGALSQDECGGINPMSLIFQDKRVEGLFLAQWIRKRGLLNVIRQSNRVQKLIAGGQLHTTIQRRVGLDEAVEALLHYKDNMTAGKILIKPGL
jgi:NADPH:quinone reductase-like Zn-dependent oxidoreductase